MRPAGITGKPDFTFPDERIAIFMDGAFWHGAPQFNRFPKSNVDYWKPKIEGNRRRDKIVTNQLRRRGWAVLRFWDYELKDNPQEIIKRIRNKVKQREKNKGVRPTH